MLNRRHVLALAGLPTLSHPALAAWPERPLRVVVPYAAGGNIDVVSRLLAPRLTERLGQPVVVDNRPGAGGSLGADQVARAAPDGYTLLAGSNGPITVNPLVQARLPYEPLRDFMPVALVNAVPLVLMVTNDTPAATIAEAVALSRSQPGAFTTGTPGAGSAAHLTLELFNNATGAALVHVPYRGGGAIVPDFLSGSIRAMFTEFSTALPLSRDGRGRVLAIASARRSPLLPDVPTFIEAGLPGFTAASYCGLLAPRATPMAVVAALRDAAAATTSEPAIRAKLEEMGSEVASGVEQTPEGFERFLRKQATDAKRAADLAGIKPE